MDRRILISIVIFTTLALSGCSAKRDLKAVTCLAKKQPSENKCLEQLAIDTKDAAPCDRIRPIFDSNGTLVFPTKVSCYAEVAYWRGERSACDSLLDSDESFECKYRFDLYMDAARIEVV
ncbi:MAG: hypothetical protein ABH863_06055 [Candidatus Micrarchaeota archaeon]